MNAITIRRWHQLEPGYIYRSLDDNDPAIYTVMDYDADGKHRVMRMVPGYESEYVHRNDFIGGNDMFVPSALRNWPLCADDFALGIFKLSPGIYQNEIIHGVLVVTGEVDVESNGVLKNIYGLLWDGTVVRNLTYSPQYSGSQFIKIGDLNGVV